MAYTKVSLPKDLAEKIRDIIMNTNLGYRSVQEFVIDATRRRVEEVEKTLLQRKELNKRGEI